VGVTVHRAISATRAVVRTNTNLGIVLLLAPLAAVPPGQALRSGVEAILGDLDVYDARHVFAAIRLASPGGLGDAPAQDVRDAPTLPLRAVMALARDRDLVARQYANGFYEVLDEGVPALLGVLRQGHTLEESIVATHLELLARHPDSLIARKYGLTEAEDVSRRARAVLDAGWPGDDRGRQAFAEFDAWLRAGGRNPGTTADLVTACLFAALRENDIGLPLSVAWSRG
jgi:triphosphoribosyl-dephospho-CoA synthase